MVKEIGAEKTCPIHTEQAILFSRFMRDLKTEVILPQKENRIQNSIFRVILFSR